MGAKYIPPDKVKTTTVLVSRQDNVGVAPLLDNGVLHTDSLSKACILNKQFVSVFTREEVTDIPKLHGPNYPDITDLGISTEANPYRRGWETRQ